MKSKLIAVQEGLHEVAQLLREKGYRIASVDETTEAIDVIIYSNLESDYLAHNMTGQLHIGAYNKFVKMINVNEVGMENLISTIEELE